MNRRTLLKYLAAIPFVGALFPKSAPAVAVRPIVPRLIPGFTGEFSLPGWSSPSTVLHCVNGRIVRIEEGGPASAEITPGNDVSPAE